MRFEEQGAQMLTYYLDDEIDFGSSDWKSKVVSGAMDLIRGFQILGQPLQMI